MTSFVDVESKFIDALDKKGHYHKHIIELYQEFVTARYELIINQRDFPCFNHKQIELKHIYRRLKNNIIQKITKNTILIIFMVIFYIFFGWLTLYKTDILSPAWLKQKQLYPVPEHMMPLMGGLFRIFAIEVLTATGMTMFVGFCIFRLIIQISRNKLMLSIIDDHVE